MQFVVEWIQAFWSQHHITMAKKGRDVPRSVEVLQAHHLDH